MEQSVIATVSGDQTKILANIMVLYCPDGFELDPTYSKGVFYKDILEPKYKFDLNPQLPGVEQCDCRSLPFPDASISNIVFDPPFVAGLGKEGKPGIIRTRFGSFKNIQKELWGFYEESLKEFYRILKDGGILVFKCQDTISGGLQYLSHVEIVNQAVSGGFYPLDLFILVAASRLMSPNMAVQQHARKFHSYFLVFRKEKSKVKYSEP